MTKKNFYPLCFAALAVFSDLSLAIAPPKQVLAAPAFEPQTVALSAVALPAFPYLDWPARLDDGYRTVLADKEFDQAFVIAGRTLRAVEGRIQQRNFPNDPTGWSAIAAQRNYANAIEKLGGVKVNTVLPGDPNWISQQGGDAEALSKKLRLTDNGDNHEGRGVVSYDTYLIRRTQNNIWIVVAEVAGGNGTSLLMVEEKPMAQIVAPLAAEQLAAALQQAGHVAVYLPFDTDRDIINAASMPIIDQMVKLLRSQPALRLQIEGHTDGAGDAAHNKVLSLARAGRHESSHGPTGRSRQIACRRLR